MKKLYKTKEELEQNLLEDISDVIKEYHTYFADIKGEALLRNAMEAYLLFVAADTIPYKNIQNIAKEFSQSFYAILASGLNDDVKEKEKNTLARKIASKVFVHKKQIAKIFLYVKDKRPYTVKGVDVLHQKGKDIYLIEKDKETGISEAYVLRGGDKAKGYHLFTRAYEVPGLKIDGLSTKKESSPTIDNDTKNKTSGVADNDKDSEEKKKELEFLNLFGDFSGNDQNGESVIAESNIYLAIPNKWVAHKKSLPSIDKFGNIKKHNGLEEEIEEDIKKIKALGGRWSSDKKMWFIPKGAPIKDFKKWLPGEVDKQIFEKIPDNELGGALRYFENELTEYGINLKGEPLKPDVSWVSVELSEDAGKNKKAASYLITTAGKNIYCTAFSFKPEYPTKQFKYEVDSRINHLNGKVKEVRMLYSSAINMARTATMKEGGKVVDLEMLEEQKENAEVCKYEYEKALPADPNYPYLANKGLRGHTYTLRQTKPWKDRMPELIIPFYDIDGKMWSIQRIGYNPKTKKWGKWTGLSKRKNTKGELVKRPTRSSGCFYIVSKEPIVTPAGIDGPFILAEGFATAASLNLALGQPVIMAIAAENMVKAAKELHKKFPNKKIIIASDNDTKDPDNPKPNGGLIAAKKAQDFIGTEIVSIVECELSDNEIRSGWTDFNDIWTGMKREKALDRIRNAFHNVVEIKHIPGVEIGDPSLESKLNTNEEDIENNGTVSPP